MAQQKDFWSGTAARAKTRLKQRQGAFLLCMLAGFLLAILCLGFSVYSNASKVEIFEAQLFAHVDYQALNTDEESLQSFAQETIQYLTGNQGGWNPQITLSGFPAASFIPQDFRDHMAEVKVWFGNAKVIFLLGLVAVLVFLCISMTLGRTRNRKGFSLFGYYLGVGIMLLLLLVLGIWIMVDFQNLWLILHEVLIPDGIFPAGEPVMLLFPLALFEGYIPPVIGTFGLLLLAVLALPILLSPISQWVATHQK